MVDLSDDEVDDVIDELEDALVLEPWGTDTWRFRHELLREVAAELAPPSVRRGLHAKVADALIGDRRAASRTGGWSPATTSGPNGSTRRPSAYQQASERGTAARRAGRGADLPDPGHHPARPGSPGPDRDRLETAVRLRRGFLGAAEGGLASASDFERCMELVETAEQNNDELLATLTGLNYYYWLRGDLRRVARVIEIIGANLIDLQRWPVQQSLFEHACGVLAQQRGEFDEARSLLQRATTSWAAVDDHDIDAHWFMPVDPLVNAQLHLALDGMLRADLTAAHAALAQAAQRVAQFGFPQGPFNHAHMLWLEAWISIEAGQLDRAATAAGDLTPLAEQHGLTSTAALGTVLRMAVDGLVALGAPDFKSTQLQPPSQRLPPPSTSRGWPVSTSTWSSSTSYWAGC